MKYGRTKWCYKCGGTKMKTGGQSSGWGNTLGFGRIIEHRNVDKLPYFQDGGFQNRVSNISEPNTSLLDSPFMPTRKVTNPVTGENFKVFGKEDEPFSFNPMNIGNAINYGVGAFSELAGMYDRNMQQEYVNRMQNNPLSGILPFDDMRSGRVEEGYNMMKGGGLFANYWAKRRRGEAAGTRKPNKSSATKEEWEKSAKTAKKKEGGINIKPENRGKFTTWAKQRGMSVTEAENKVMSNTEEYSPSIVKMANFSRNARKWN